MELVKISEKIKDLIALIETERLELKGKATNKADTLATYEKELGKTILKLKNNAINEYDGQNCLNLPVSIIEKIAKSICSQERLNADTADMLYKATITSLSALTAELNGYQSINKFQQEI